MDDRGTRGMEGAHVGRAGGPPVEERQLGVVRVDVRERARVHVRREPDRLAEADVRPRPEHAGVAAAAPHRTHAPRVPCDVARRVSCHASCHVSCHAICHVPCHVCLPRGVRRGGATDLKFPARSHASRCALPRYILRTCAHPCTRCDTTRTAQRDPMRCAGVQDATCGRRRAADEKGTRRRKGDVKPSIEYCGCKWECASGNVQVGMCKWECAAPAT